MLRFRTVAAFCALAGCANPTTVALDDGADAGAGPADEAPEPRVLDVLGKSSYRLGPSEVIALEVRLTEADGTPVAGERLTFALVGRAQDSSLDSLHATTDADGVAQNRLLAGTRVATFRVRAAAADATDAYVDVAVSDAGFGTLAVAAEYTGVRAVAERVLTAQADAECDTAESVPGDPMVVVTEEDTLARFLGLPADTTYAVTAVAQGPDGIVLATGCVDGIVVVADAEVYARIEFSDEPLVPAGAFELEGVLDTTEPAESLGFTVEQAARMLAFGTPDAMPIWEAQASFVLDSLDRTLRADPYASEADFVGLADAIAAERAIPTLDPTLDAELAAALEAAGGGPAAALELLVERVRVSLSETRLYVDVTLDDGGEELPMSWHALALEALPVRDGVSPPYVDLDALDATDDAQATFLSASDALEIDGVDFGVAFGSLAVEVARNLASLDLGEGEALRDALACEAFVAWIGSKSIGPRTCDEKCALSTCDRAIARIVDAAEVDLLALDVARPRLTLHGELGLVDDDGDLLVEHMSSEFVWGTWHPPSADTAGDFVSGTATATSVEPPVDAP